MMPEPISGDQVNLIKVTKYIRGKSDVHTFHTRDYMYAHVDSSDCVCCIDNTGHNDHLIVNSR